MNRLADALATVAVALTVISCGDSTGPSEVGGPHSYTVTGDIEGMFEGNAAVFGLQADDQGIGQWFINTLELVESNIQGVSIVYNGQNPGTGTFAIADVDLQPLPQNEFGAFLALVANSEEPGYVGNSLSGTITISENTSTSVKATFEFTANGVAKPLDGPSESASVLVTGQVDAIPAN